MRILEWCGMLALWAALPLAARAQTADVLPTMPALPIHRLPEAMPALPAVPLGFDGAGMSPYVPTFFPPLPPLGQFPDSFYPRPELYPVGYTPEPEPPRFYQPVERSYVEPPAAAPVTPPVTYLPESVPVRTRPTLGQLIYAIFHPFRRTSESLAMEPTHEPASQVELAAMAIRADEMSVERRRTAIQYLASIDCAFNPEAEAGLLTALRSDRHESVRYEAAVALCNSWCWTAKTIAALGQTMTGGTADGHPGERSDRVRQAAWRALSYYAASINPRPQTLPPQLPTTPVRRTSFDASPAEPINKGFYPPGRTAQPQEADISRLPPLRPIGRVPEVEPEQPTYEPTPISPRRQ